MSLIKYQKPIEEKFNIIDKKSNNVPFRLNKVQLNFLEQAEGRDIILKARQLGFSSLILAIFACDFLYRPYSFSVVVADNTDNSLDLLDRVKIYLKSYEEKSGNKIPLKYNSKYEMYNQYNGARYKIGSAENREFGRSKTITNLHLAEISRYPNAEKIFASALQAVTPKGRVFIETTANGFNYFKSLWDESELGERPFKTHFYNYAWEDEYDEQFIRNKRAELKRLFVQEYPENAQEAFITSGDTYFDKFALESYLKKELKPTKEDLIYI